jgi:hypothetical protein
MQQKKKTYPCECSSVIEQELSMHGFNMQHQKEKSNIRNLYLCLTPVILATQEGEIRRTSVQSQPQANSS